MWNTITVSSNQQSSKACTNMSLILAISYTIVLVHGTSIRTTSLLRTHSENDDTQPAVVLSAREALFCDVCVRNIKHCNRYIPDVKLFDTNRPPAETNLGSLVECQPSEAEFWITDGRFKLGDGEHEEETRDGCPSPRRRPNYEGKLLKAQRICSLAKQKITAGNTVVSCTADLNKFQSTSVSRRARRDCDKRFFLMSEEDDTENPQEHDAEEVVNEMSNDRDADERTGRASIASDARRDTQQEINDDNDLTDTAAAVSEHAMNLINRIACDVCLNKVKSCADYRPNPQMLSSEFPSPSKLGRLLFCEASERMYYARADSFKMTAEELSKTQCKGTSVRRAPTLDGRLGLARRHCGRYLKKVDFENCQESATGIAGRVKKNRPAEETCTKENLYTYK